MTLTWKQKGIKAIFDRYMRWCLNDLMHPEYPVILDYPIRPEPRYGSGKPPHSELAVLLARDDESYLSTLGHFAAFRKGLLQIEEVQPEHIRGEPCWDNAWFSSLDAIVLYGLLASRKPSRYLEVGSGYSTKFARRAVRDTEGKTKITSIDPAPRAEIDSICDHIIRQPLETLEMYVFDDLEAGDFLFFDSSHRVFQNSDVTVFFMEILPRLKPGVIVHIHDVFLPFDYPTVWKDRYYSEQYLLAAYLLAGSSRIEVLLPLAYIGRDSRAGAFVDETWATPLFQRAFSQYREITGGYIGTSFWLTIK